MGVSTDYSAHLVPTIAPSKDPRVVAARLLLVNLCQVVTHFGVGGEEPRGAHERLGRAVSALMKCTQPKVSHPAASDWPTSRSRSETFSAEKLPRRRSLRSPPIRHIATREEGRHAARRNRIAGGAAYPWSFSSRGKRR